MAGIKAKSEAPALHELSSEELNAVSGGDAAADAAKKAAENKKQAEATKVFQQAAQGSSI